MALPGWEDGSKQRGTNYNRLTPAEIMGKAAPKIYAISHLSAPLGSAQK